VERSERIPDPLLARLDAAHARLGAAHQRFLELIAEADRAALWADDGARDLAHWLWMRYGISDWKARRFIDAAHALAGLPRVATALETGALGVDKVVELTRFATDETEDQLVEWAARVSAARIRHEGDVLRRADDDEPVHDDEVRSVSWSYRDEGRRFEMHAELPAAQGATVAQAIDRITATIPPMPGERATGPGAARRADALVALCSARLAADPDPERATIVLHARVGREAGVVTAAEIEGGGIAQRTVLERLLCAARIETVHEDATGRVIGVGRITRVPPAWLLRQVRFRDKGCRFPGCGARGFTQAHHIVFWRDGGGTDLSNLALLCSWHHKLVHEYGWWIKGYAEGELRWYKPDGTRYRAGPVSPESEAGTLDVAS
jgi:Domain of unknown function (DUF222)/HNH endonuclease